MKILSSTKRRGSYDSDTGREINIYKHTHIRQSRAHEVPSRVSFLRLKLFYFSPPTSRP